MYFVALTLSGIFSIIFSVAFAYVSDVTDEASRSLGYGMVTAGFAASLIVSPALGAGVEMVTGREDLVIILASLTALLDVAFILLLVPESLDTKVNFKSLTFKQVLESSLVFCYEGLLDFRWILSRHFSRSGLTRPCWLSAWSPSSPTCLRLARPPASLFISLLSWVSQTLSAS